MLSFFLLAASGFVWTDLGGGRMELREEGKPYLVYNSGPVLAAGVPEDRRRCCYIYPVYTPGGVSMLDDFPKDHYHHRGLFWGWPVVETAFGKVGLWMMKGVEHRRVGAVKTSGGVLEVENGWFVGEKEIVREVLEIVASRTEGGARTMAVTLRWEALDAPVTLKGSQEKGKSYGGFSARFGPRERTVIRSSEGMVARDEDLVKHGWAEMEAMYGGKRAVLRITADRATEWCMRGYGFVGSSFPGRDGYTLRPGEPLRMRFEVRVGD